MAKMGSSLDRRGFVSKPTPFPRKAAFFSLVAALACVAGNFLTREIAKQSQIITVGVGVLSAILVLAGLIAAIAALFGIPKYGKKGILWPALAGLGLNALVVGVTVWVGVLAWKGGVPTLQDLDLRKQLIGTWVSSDAGTTTEIHLGEDGSFRFVLTGDSVADFSGKWSLQRRRLYLNVEKIVDGNRDRIGNQLRWSLDRLEGDELVLGAANGQDRYVRKGPAK
jgi:hypothetical protein